MIQFDYRSKYLVIIDDSVYVYKYEKSKFDALFLSVQPKHVFIGKSKIVKRQKILELKIVLNSMVTQFY